MIAWLENELDRDAKPYTPPPGLHRLNRTEYANSIRDLLDLPIDPAKYLPSDDSTSRVRQHRRRARHFLDAGRSVCDRGAEDQQARGWRARGADARRIPHPRGHVAGLSRRRAAVRHARRPAGRAPVSLRRRVHAHGHADLRRQHDADRVRLGAMRADRVPARRRAAGARGLERRGTGARDRVPRPSAGGGRERGRTGRKRSSAKARRCVCART